MKSIHVDEWEKAGEYPIREIFKKMGDLGILGIHKLVRNTAVWVWTIPITLSPPRNWVPAIPVGSPLGGCANRHVYPTIARFGSDQLKEEFRTRHPG